MIGNNIYGKLLTLPHQHQIVHPAQTICDHLRSIKFEGLIYCLATSPFKEILVNAGFRLAQEVGIIDLGEGILISRWNLNRMVRESSRS